MTEELHQQYDGELHDWTCCISHDGSLLNPSEIKLNMIPSHLNRRQPGLAVILALKGRNPLEAKKFIQNYMPKVLLGDAQAFNPALYRELTAYSGNLQVFQEHVLQYMTVQDCVALTQAFSPRPSQPESLPDNWLHRLFSSPKQRVLQQTSSPKNLRGFLMFSDRFNRYRHEEPKIVNSYLIHSVARSPGHAAYILTVMHFTHQLMLTAKKMENLNHTSSEKNVISQLDSKSIGMT